MGIFITGSSYHSIRHNNVNSISSSNSIAYGIYLFLIYSTVTDNVFSNIQAPTRFGINLDGNFNVVVGNTLYNTGTGISISGAGNVIANNVVF